MSAAADDQGRGEDAEGDTFGGIQNIIGSNFDDALTGNGQANTFHGGTDTINDNGGNIIFEQGAGNDYRGAVYTFTRANEGRGEAVTITVRDGGNELLNVIEFASDPLPDYDFTTRIGITETDIPTSSLVVPARQNSQSSPPLSADSIGNVDPLDGSGSATSSRQATARRSSKERATG